MTSMESLQWRHCWLNFIIVDCVFVCNICSFFENIVFQLTACKCSVSSVYFCFISGFKPFVTPRLSTFKLRFRCISQFGPCKIHNMHNYAISVQDFCLNLQKSRTWKKCSIADHLKEKDNMTKCLHLSIFDSRESYFHRE